MKNVNMKKSTQELIGLGMALQGDKETMEMRIRGIFSRRKSSRIASVTAMLLALALAFACFTTACYPVVAEAMAAEALIAANETTEAAADSLLSFDGYAKGVLDGNRITVTDAKGGKHEFTWVDEGVRAHSEPITQGTYVSPGEAALHGAETAVTISGDAVPSCEIHVNMYTGDGKELVYYGIGFGGTPFEPGEIAYGYADAATGTLLRLDTCNWGLKNGDGKVQAFSYSDEKYAAVHTSEKALATAMELIRTCFPTGKIVPADPVVWDAGSHTDGEQISYDDGYVALVDAYIRMDKDPCYYVQVAVPLEEGATPSIRVFGCYPLGWEYCWNQIHDPAILREEMADLEEIRSGAAKADDGVNESAADADLRLAANAAQMEELCGSIFAPKTDMWKQGDSAEEYSKVFLVRYGAYLDDGFEDSDPMLDPAQVATLAKRGNVLRLESNGAFLYAVYLGDGQMIYADATTMRVCQISVADWMKDRADCSCCILTWR